MKDSDYGKLIDLVNVGGGFVPANANAEELLNMTTKGQQVTFKEVTQRDIKMHRCYMALLAFIWGYMPPKFRETIPKEKFYKWLKHFKKEYSVEFTFKDGSQLIEYTSISFAKMGQKEFEKYIAEQLPYIYEYVLGAYFEGDMLNSIIETIETEFKQMLQKLP